MIGYVAIAFIVSMVLFMAGILPIPVGYERSKLKWIMWCGTGIHAHIVYWTDHGFQTLHPADRTEGA
jgi:hypothetical protein